MSSRLIIDSIELEGFKAFKDKVVFKLGEGLNIIHGPVGSGKSSIIQAIEFALYGNQLEARERIARLSDLINEESAMSRVVVKVGGMVVERGLVRRGESAIQSLLVNGAKGNDKDIVDALGIGIDEFERFILVTHRTLEDLVYGSLKERTLAIDRLFGVEFLEVLGSLLPIRRISEAIEERKRSLANIREVEDLIRKYGSIRAISDKRNELAREIEEIRERIRSLTSAYAELTSRRAKMIETIRSLEDKYARYLYIRERLRELDKELEGVKEDDYAETFIRGSLEVVRHMLLPRLESAMLQEQSEAIEKASTIDELLATLYKGVNALEGRVNELEEELAALRKSRDELARLIDRLRNELSAMSERLTALEKGARQYMEYVKTYGELGRIKAELEELRLRYSQLDAEVRFKAAALDVINYILAKLESEGKAECPVDGSTIERGLMDSLRARAAEIERELKELKILELRGRISELERIVSEMEGLYSQYMQYVELSRRIDEYRAQLNQSMDKMQRMDKAIMDLERRIKEYRGVIDLARKRIEEAEARYNILKKIREREALRSEESELLKVLKESGINLEEAVQLDEALKDAEAKLGELKRRLEEATSEYMRIDLALSKMGQVNIDVEKVLGEIKELEELLAKMSRILGKLRDVQLRVRGEVVEAIQAGLNDTFRQLYPYGDLSGAVIKLKQRRGGGSDYALYAIRGGKEVPVSRLSDGQRITLAQSFILTVYRLMSRNVGFILMDEPIPYVDVNVKEAFSRTLAKALAEGIVRQVVLATQDENLVNLLSKSCGDAGIGVNIVKLPVSKQ